MKRKQFTETQIMVALKQYESGREVNDVCREYGIHKATFYNWRFMPGKFFCPHQTKNKTD